MRIGLDLDGVVADWITSAKDLLEERGSRIPSLDPPYWNWLKEQARPEDWKWLWGPGMKYSYQFARPYPGAIEFANKLRKLGDVVILTSRPEGSWTTTIQWWWDHMVYTPTAFNFFREGIEKANVKTDVFIEDNFDYAESYAKLVPYSRVFLLDRPWNSGYNSYIVDRVASYQEILERIERLKNENTE